MDLRPYVETIHQQLLIAAEAGGDEARAVAERLIAAVDSTVRLAVQDALVAAAEEITCDLAPGSVELRLRGRDPEFVVLPPAGFAGGPRGNEAGPAGPPAGASPATDTDSDDGGMARVNLRLPDQLKARAEQAAANERLSLNAWLVRAVTAALERAGSPRRDGTATAASSKRYVGWAR